MMKCCLLLACLSFQVLTCGAEVFRVVTYNLEAYLDQPAEGRRVKSGESKAKIRESIRALKPDVLAVEEMGALSALKELQASLKDEGLDLPNAEFVHGWDTNIHVAVLSRFPMITRRSHTNDSFLLNGRRFHVSRGFADVDIQLSTNFTFTLLAAHLKSKRAVPEADEAELRVEEAKLLREKIEARFTTEPGARIVVVGDFNDNKDAPSTRTIIGRGRNKLIDTRPAEKNGDNLPNSNPAWEPRNITWTHYYGKEDTYSRIDYILISQTMASHWLTNETKILTMPNWGLGSDHRPIMAAFESSP